MSLRKNFENKISQKSAYLLKTAYYEVLIYKHFDQSLTKLRPTDFGTKISLMEQN